ncbi:hypothetical protein [Salinibacterium sp. ZJ454]|uniref:hypothetical protein n=1 Tax=Salinibacterium sp. ZJ454 TaxID=2708339 RepID=UPI0014243C67|nr:hypothetical protein [Salinibacterium sp. ZJ454]
MSNFQLEAGLTLALWDLFSAEGPNRVANEALLRQLPLDDARVQRFRTRVEQHGTRAWVPRVKPCPDLTLLGPDDDGQVADILAVIEVKARAETHWPPRTVVESLAPLEDAVAKAIQDDYQVGARSRRIGACQSDVYRAWKWWAKEETNIGVRLERPDEVLWLLFDTRGRTTEKAFSDSSAPGAWLSVDLKLFAAHLRELRTVRALTDAQRDAIAVVLWHVQEAPGKDHDVTTSIKAEQGLRPALLNMSETDE